MEFNELESAIITEVKKKIREQILATTTALTMPKVLSDVIRKGIVTGGMSASLFHESKVNDWDIYLTSQADIDAFNDIIKNSVSAVNLIEDVNPKYGVETLMDGKLVTAQATTFKNKLQVITMSCADARETFDYVHCMPYYVIETDTYNISRRQYESIMAKKLVHNPKSVQPADYRRQKFLNRGWT